MSSGSIEFPKSIGFIGLGAMGYPMCMNLHSKLPISTPLHVYDLNTSALQQFVSQSSGKGSVAICVSSRDVAERSDVVITILPEGSHVKSVYLAPEIGILSASRSSSERGGRLLLDCSTIDAASSLDVGSEVVKTGFGEFVDAPVSGGTMGAEKGTLTFMVGIASENPTFSLIKQILRTMGSEKSIIACGGPSLGIAAKLSNNYLSGITAIATAEAMNLGMRMGIDAKTLASIIAVSTGSNYVNDKCNPVPGVSPGSPPSNNYMGGFKVQLMKKDFGLAVASAEKVKAKLVLGEVGLRTYTEASEDPRCKDRDSRVVYRYLGGKE